MTNQQEGAAVAEQQELTVEQAAARLGISKWATYKAVTRGELSALPGSGPVRLVPAVVEEFRRRRQASALERLSARGVDLVQLARDTAAHLKPMAGTVPGKVGDLGQDVTAAFGRPALLAAAMRDPGVCRWCAARTAAELLHAPAPAYGEAMLALLGRPCEKDMARFAGAEMERLRVQVHGPSARPSGVRAHAAPAVPARAAVRPAEPVQDGDGGKSLVSRRLREVRARQKDARRRGDQAYALRMAQMARDLEKDAAVVDGRPAVTASAARPGTLRCGHELAAGCACPRRASVRSAR